MSIEVTPSQLNVYPILVAGGTIQNIFALQNGPVNVSTRVWNRMTHISDERRSRDIPLCKIV
jgi:hypothetical protein